MAKCHLKKYWVAVSAQTHKSVLYPLGHFLEFRKGRNEPIAERGASSVLIFFDLRSTALLGKYEVAVAKRITEKSKPNAKIRQNITYEVTSLLFGNSAGLREFLTWASQISTSYISNRMIGRASTSVHDNRPGKFPPPQS